MSGCAVVLLVSVILEEDGSWMHDICPCMEVAPRQVSIGLGLTILHFTVRSLTQAGEACIIAKTYYWPSSLAGMSLIG